MTTKNFPKISIIIPNYNDAQTLSFYPDAVLNSDYPNLETVVLDNKSTNNSIGIIKKFNVRLLVHKKILPSFILNLFGLRQTYVCKE